MELNNTGYKAPTQCKPQTVSWWLCWAPSWPLCPWWRWLSCAAGWTCLWWWWCSQCSSTPLRPSILVICPVWWGGQIKAAKLITFLITSSSSSQILFLDSFLFLAGPACTTTSIPNWQMSVARIVHSIPTSVCCYTGNARYLSRPTRLGTACPQPLTDIMEMLH